MQGDFAAALDALGEQVKTTVARAGANSMAYVFQEEAKAFAPVFTVGPKGGGGSRVARRKVKPGQLRDSIYRAHADRLSSDGSQIYEVSWNHSKAPHGHWMEYGNVRHPAHPFITPAYEAAKQRAVTAGIERMSVKYAETKTGAAK